MKLNILIVEDDENDILLLLRYLNNSKLEFEYQTVDTAENFIEAIEQNDFDIILSDFNIPGFGGDKAMQILNNSGVLVPFVLVSGIIGEEAAVLMMKAGAGDYVMKNNLSRLSEVIKREVTDSKTRKEKMEYQQKAEILSNIIEVSKEIVCTFNEEGKINFINNTGLAFFGLSDEKNNNIYISDLLSYNAYADFKNSIFLQIKYTGYWEGELDFMTSHATNVR